MPTTYAEPVLTWYARHARNLPWRAPGTTPWAVLVSEFMLQQTPVARVMPEYLRWMARWPTPAALAADPAGEAIRQWGRLGYPRRALRLHETAVIVTERHGGTVPADLDALRALPGVGSYTAAAVASFAFGQRHAVLDTNVRRVLARLISGQPAPAPATSVAERRLAESLLPAQPAVAARWAVAVMELGALVCTAASPRCPACPVARDCAWLAAGRPAEAPEAARRRTQKYDGTDRQCRGRLLAVLRQAGAPVSRADFDAAWPGREQLERALDGLIADGLVDPLPDGRFALPGSAPAASATPCAVTPRLSGGNCTISLLRRRSDLTGAYVHGEPTGAAGGIPRVNVHDDSGGVERHETRVPGPLGPWNPGFSASCGVPPCGGAG